MYFVWFGLKAFLRLTVVHFYSIDASFTLFACFALLRHFPSLLLEVHIYDVYDNSICVGASCASS
jgi:hypothetical protein